MEKMLIHHGKFLEEPFKPSSLYSD